MSLRAIIMAEYAKEKPGIWHANRRMMDEMTAGGHRRLDPGRPALGFPLGTALVLLVVFGVSALFSCCYHWEKIRNFHSRHAAAGNNNNNNSSSGRTSFSDLAVPSVLTPTVHVLPLPQIVDSTSSKNALQQSRSLPVVMPGDSVPKFIAWPSPCTAKEPV